MKRVITVGETTYDIIFRNTQPTGAVVGGSVLNTSISLGRLGIPVTFASRMGNDQVGNLSIDFLKANSINCDYITRFDGNSRLALAFLDEHNNASYEFYKGDKSPSLNFPELSEGDVVVFGSTNAIKDEGRNNLLLFLNQAYDRRSITIYDPNIRECNAMELIEVRRKVKENFHFAKIVKGSTDDFNRLYDTSDADDIYEMIRLFGVEVLLITGGSKPVQVKTPQLSFSLPVPKIVPVSTIGAGDNFTAGLIYGLSQKPIFANNLTSIGINEWKEILQAAIDFSSEVCLSDANYISVEFAREYKAKLFAT